MRVKVVWQDGGVINEADGPTRSLQERRRTATRYDIALAAVTLFEEQGFENTTVEQIAGRAGVSLRTFYRYCAGKDEAVTSELVGGPRDLAERIAARRHLPLLQAIHDGFVESVRSSASAEADHRKILGLILTTPALRAAWLAAGRAAQDDVAGIFRDRCPELTAVGSTALAAATTATLTVAIEQWVAAPASDLSEVAMEALGSIRTSLTEVESL